jgi:rRNA maturation RNase YbeY
MAIQFFTEEINFNLKHKNILKKWLKDVCALHSQRKLEELSYIFCSDEYLLNMNKEYLQHDYYTDIITFDNSEETPNSPINGEMYLSIDRITDNASLLGITFEQEIQRVIVHGLLHLLGFDDHTPEDIAKIRKAEEEALNLLITLITKT